MRPNLQEEGLVDRQILLRFHERSTALHVAQNHSQPRYLLPRPARHGRPHYRLRARGLPTEPLGRCCVKFSGENCSEDSAATTALLWRTFAVCVILYTSLYA
jgi:hypothetical protein